MNRSKKTMRQIFNNDRMQTLSHKASQSHYWRSILIFVESNWDVKIGKLKPTEQMWLENILETLEIE